MQILVLYFSRTGNTKKLAEEIIKGIHDTPGVASVLKSVVEVQKEDFIAADAIIAGSPVYFGGMAAELKAVFDNFVSVRRKMGIKSGRPLPPQETFPVVKRQHCYLSSRPF